jgi:hypothetical protein
MRNRFGLSVLAAFALILLWLPAPLDASSEPQMDFRLDLAILHPEVVAHPAFRSWGGTHTLARWSEGPRTEAGQQVVFVQDTGEVRSSVILAFNVRYGPAGATVVSVVPFSAADVSKSFDAAVGRIPLGRKLISAAPSIDLSSPNPLGWRIRVGGLDAGIFEIRGDKVSIQPLALTPTDCPGGVDDLGDNELHHLENSILISDVLAITKGLDSSKQMNLATALNRTIAATYRGNYDDETRVFTVADTITRASRLAACDERAVLLVTYLRILHIKARMKFLLWFHGNGSQHFDHAVVECIADGAVHYFDPTFGYVDHPEKYRSLTLDSGEPITDVKVVDVDWPLDARSTTAVGGFPDDDGDGYLNQWADFCYTPSKEGIDRAPYSR